MGIGFIIIGFFFLHFQFLYLQVYNFELLTITLSLIAILLGMLYAYHYTRSKIYLIFSFVCLVMALLTFLPNVRSLFLFFQTLFYTTYLLYMIKKFPDLSNIRFLKIATFIYFVMGLGKMLCFTNHYYFIIMGNNIYTLFSIGVCLSALITFWFLWKIRQLTYQESRPHTTPLTIPLYQYIIILLLSLCFLVMIHQPFVEYIYNQDKQLDIYELENNQVTIQYILDWHKELPNHQLSTLDIIPLFYFHDNSKPKNVQIMMNNTTVFNGQFDYTTQTPHLIETENVTDDILFSILPDCQVVIDGVASDIQLKKVEYDEYGYEDNNIKISHCYISNQRVITFPRIEWKRQNIKLDSMFIIDNQNQIIGELNNYNNSQNQYYDYQSIYFESPCYLPTMKSQKPYRIKIKYYNQDNQIIEKEFSLEKYENHK